MSNSVNQIVTVNVGGTIFTTTTDTLAKGISDKLIKTGSDSFFVDRDPTVFPYILNFLRDERVVFPDDAVTAAQLYQEAKFYNLTDLVQFISMSSYNKTGYFDLRKERS